MRRAPKCVGLECCLASALSACAMWVRAAAGMILILPVDRDLIAHAATTLEELYRDLHVSWRDGKNLQGGAVREVVLDKYCIIEVGTLSAYQLQTFGKGMRLRNPGSQLLASAATAFEHDN